MAIRPATSDIGVSSGNPLSIPDRFVGNAGNFPFQKLFSELWIGRQVKIGEEQLSFAHPGIFRFDWFLDFNDHFGSGPNIVSGTDNLCACLLIKSILKTRTITGTLLNGHLMARVSQGANTRGR